MPETKRGYRILKRLMDVCLSAVILAVSLPVTGLALLAVWLQDRRSPFYLAQRTGRGGMPFKMLKIRSMVVDADKVRVWATASDDKRITRIGAVIRACKLDEVPQFWNVLVGDMSLIGPRPLALSETAVYTDVERGILDLSPGVTDIASIVFADEGDILEGSSDPTGTYDRLVRPWKSRLALFYAEKQSIPLDVALLALTGLAIVNRRLALRGIGRVLTSLGANAGLVEAAARTAPLVPIEPPGAPGQGSYIPPITRTA